MSRERQNRYNRERARRRLALLMDANFGKNDLHVTLTYRGTPPDYEQARKDVRNYLRAVKRMREKAGLPEMKYIYVLEEEGADGEKRRIHVHLMMTGGISREALEEKWGRGYPDCNRQPEEGNGLMELARYFTKLEQEKHRRAWSTVQESAEAPNHRQPHTHEQRPGAQAVPGDPRKRGGDHGKTVSGVQGGRGGAVCERLDTGGIFADTAAEAMPMSGKKHCKGVDVVCPFGVAKRR